MTTQDPADPSGEIMQPNVPASAAGSTFSVRFWLLVVATGIGAGLGADALMALLHSVQHIFYDYRNGPFQAAVDRTSALHRVEVLAGAGVFAGLSWMVLRRVTHSHGTSLSEAIWEKQGKMPYLENIANAVLEMVAVGLGAPLGREGAPKDAGGALASKLSDWARLSRSDRRLLVAFGAGAGMAAVYNVPLGGALFSLEVLLGTLSLPLVLPALATSFIATAVSWVALPSTTTYAVAPLHLSDVQIVWALICGPIVGISAILYLRLISLAKMRKPQGWRLLAALTITFTCVGLVAIAYPQILGNGKDVAGLAFAGKLTVPILAGVLVLKPLATSASLRSGAVGGLFTPSLNAGAMVGGLLGFAWLQVFPGSSVGVFAILGSAGFLAAVMQGPLSALVLVMELTGQGLPIMVPLLIVVTGATLTSRALDDRSIYSAPLRKHGSFQPSVHAPGWPKRKRAISDRKLPGSADYTSTELRATPTSPAQYHTGDAHLDANEPGATPAAQGSTPATPDGALLVRLWGLARGVLSKLNSLRRTGER
ncbi:MAG: chloride channel protein [Actinobacteria bacterium]|nr:chloride channel protein [Actinomycetota bacterium]